MNVIVGGRKLTLNENRTLGTGGEATVITDGRAAYKIFHSPSVGKQRKVEALIRRTKQLPPRVLAPIELVYDESGQKFVGYKMPLAPKGAEPLIKLANKNFRKSRGIGPLQIVELFLDAHSTLVELHKQGFVVGDLNDLNELFVDGKVYFVDVDSFQFESFGCEVATEPYLCPSLFGENVANMGFSPETDWYSYAVLLFRSLLLVHPYGGNDIKYKLLMDRARFGVSVFDRAVRYPKIGLPRELLSLEMQDQMLAIFELGRFGLFPRSLLEGYKADLAECNKCGEHFPMSRGKCPFCDSKVAPREIEIHGHYVVTKLITTSGEFIFTKLVGLKFYAIAIEADRYVLYYYNGNLETYPLMAVTPGVRFDIAFGQLVISMKGKNKVVIMNLRSGEVTATTATENFRGAPIVAGTTTALYRISHGLLIQSRLVGSELLDRVILTIPSGQTWVAAGETDMGDKLLIAGQVFGRWNWRVITKGLAYEARIAQLEENEKVISFAAKFDTHGAFVLRECKQAGKTFVRLDYVDNEGKLLASTRDKIDLASLEGFAGAAFGNGHLIIPTANGLKGKSILTGDIQYFTGSEDFIDGAEKLYNYRGSLIIVENSTIHLAKKGD